MNLVRQVWGLTQDPRATKWLCPLQLLGEAALGVLIIEKVPYTNIDWDAYMQQVETYLAGERNYVKIHGDTGPLVYPALHVYIYRALHYVTSNGSDVRLAQYIFLGVYIIALALVMQTYRASRVPPWVFPLLSLSKRMHSIFVLRLFNDCFAVLFLFAAIAWYQQGMWMIGTVFFSMGLGVKMSLLLALPAVGFVQWLGMGRNRALLQASSIVQHQFIIGLPFITSNWRSYLSKAFEFSRQFQFKWTVNWRFVGEETFLSREFSLLLLAGHVILLAFFGLTRWLPASGLTFSKAVSMLLHPPDEKREHQLMRTVTPNVVLTTILTAIIIGCLCARSLHYQFFAYIVWATPYLLWRSGLHPVLIYLIFFAQEWAWNVYPSTNISSLVVVASLAVTIASVWLGTGVAVPKGDVSRKEK